MTSASVSVAGSRRRSVSVLTKGVNADLRAVNKSYGGPDQCYTTNPTLSAGTLLTFRE
ncbi:MAG: hypothetical protein L7W43_06785 [Rubripirellula sp.]|nr:hypothetical protein [Rubripirellula sp.]